MLTKVQTWGNSQGLRLNRQVLEEAHISVGDQVDLVVQDGQIVISPARRVRGRYDLKKLIAQIPPNHKQEELAWGKPVGKEVW